MWRIARSERLRQVSLDQQGFLKFGLLLHVLLGGQPIATILMASATVRTVRVAAALRTRPLLEALVGLDRASQDTRVQIEGALMATLSGTIRNIE